MTRLKVTVGVEEKIGRLVEEVGMSPYVEMPFNAAAADEV